MELIFSVGGVIERFKSPKLKDNQVTTLIQNALSFEPLGAACPWSCIINGLHYKSSGPLPTHNVVTGALESPRVVSPARSLVNPDNTGFSLADL